MEDIFSAPDRDGPWHGWSELGLSSQQTTAQWVPTPFALEGGDAQTMFLLVELHGAYADPEDFVRRLNAVRTLRLQVTTVYHRARSPLPWRRGEALIRQPSNFDIDLADFKLMSRNYLMLNPATEEVGSGIRVVD